MPPRLRLPRRRPRLPGRKWLSYAIGLATGVLVTMLMLGSRLPLQPLEVAGDWTTLELVRQIVGLNDPYTVRQACLAMESMDLSPLVPQISRPLAAKLVVVMFMAPMT